MIEDTSIMQGVIEFTHPDGREIRYVIRDRTIGVRENGAYITVGLSGAGDVIRTPAQVLAVMKSMGV